MVKVSVVIPIYNVENYLKECLESVVNQTLKDIEIICVDDCGKDNSIKIVNEFAQQDSRIKILHHNKNKGLGAARNTGLKQARGKYIFFLDSDDYIKENILEKLYDKAEKTLADIVISNSHAFTFEKDEYTLSRIDGLNRWLNSDKEYLLSINFSNFTDAINYLPCVAWGKLYSKEFLDKNNLAFIEKNIIHEDNGFWLKICSKFPKLYFLPEIGVMYRIRKNAITTEIDKKKNKNKKHKHMKHVLKDVFKYINTHTPPIVNSFFQTQIKNSMEYNSYFYTRIGCLLNFRWAKNDKCINILGIPFFREKIRSENKKVRRILGIQVYKTSVKPININYSKYQNKIIKSLKKINIKKNKNFSLKSSNNDKNILNALNSLDHFYFLPNKGNLGDIVIAASEFQYLDANNMNYDVFEVEKINNYNNPFNFVYGGGGIWHELYEKDFQEVVNVFRSPLLEKCVILPSSFFKCDDVIKLFDERFTVFCREKQSFEYCKSLNSKAKFILADDMVINANFENFKETFYNTDNFKNFKNDVINKGKNVSKIYFYYYSSLINAKTHCNSKIGYLLRSDKESVIKNKNWKTIDPSIIAQGFGCDKGLDFLLTKIFLAFINQFDIIVTDRLHVGICATKLGKQVLLLDNSYKKLSNVYQNSLSNFNNVKITTLENVESDIQQIKINENKMYQDLFTSLPIDLEDFLIQYGSFKNSYGPERRFW